MLWWGDRHDRAFEGDFQWNVVMRRQTWQSIWRRLAVECCDEETDMTEYLKETCSGMLLWGDRHDRVFEGDLHWNVVMRRQTWQSNLKETYSGMLWWGDRHDRAFEGDLQWNVVTRRQTWQIIWRRLAVECCDEETDMTEYLKETCSGMLWWGDRHDRAFEGDLQWNVVMRRQTWQSIWRRVAVECCDEETDMTEYLKETCSGMLWWGDRHDRAIWRRLTVECCDEERETWQSIWRRLAVECCDEETDMTEHLKETCSGMLWRGDRHDRVFEGDLQWNVAMRRQTWQSIWRRLAVECCDEETDMTEYLKETCCGMLWWGDRHDRVFEGDLQWNVVMRRLTWQSIWRRLAVECCDEETDMTEYLKETCSGMLWWGDRHDRVFEGDLQWNVAMRRQTWQSIWRRLAVECCDEETDMTEYLKETCSGMLRWGYRHDRVFEGDLLWNVVMRRQTWQSIWRRLAVECCDEETDMTEYLKETCCGMLWWGDRHDRVFEGDLQWNVVMRRQTWQSIWRRLAVECCDEETDMTEYLKETCSGMLWWVDRHDRVFEGDLQWNVVMRRQTWQSIWRRLAVECCDEETDMTEYLKETCSGMLWWVDRHDRVFEGDLQWNVVMRRQTWQSIWRRLAVECCDEETDMTEYLKETCSGMLWWGDRHDRVFEGDLQWNVVMRRQTWQSIWSRLAVECCDEETDMTEHLKETCSGMLWWGDRHDRVFEGDLLWNVVMRRQTWQSIWRRLAVECCDEETDMTEHLKETCSGMLWWGDRHDRAFEGDLQWNVVMRRQTWQSIWRRLAVECCDEETDMTEYLKETCSGMLWWGDRHDRVFEGDLQWNVVMRRQTWQSIWRRLAVECCDDETDMTEHLKETCSGMLWWGDRHDRVFEGDLLWNVVTRRQTWQSIWRRLAVECCDEETDMTEYLKETCSGMLWWGDRHDRAFEGDLQWNVVMRRQTWQSIWRRLAVECCDEETDMTEHLKETCSGMLWWGDRHDWAFEGDLQWNVVMRRQTWQYLKETCSGMLCVRTRRGQSTEFWKLGTWGQ